MSSAAAGLPPGYGRRGSNSHGPGPPASEAGASPNSATSAGSAGPRRPSPSTVVRPAQWTQTDSNRLRPPCKGGAPPLVRWAHGSAGQESNLPCQKRLGYGQVPSHDGDPRTGTECGCAVAMRNHRSHCWRSLQLSRSYLGATNQAIEANQLVALAGGQGVEPRLRRVWRPPGGHCPAPSCAVLLDPLRKQKSRFLAEAAQSVNDQ